MEMESFNKNKMVCMDSRVHRLKTLVKKRLKMAYRLAYNGNGHRENNVGFVTASNFKFELNKSR